MEAATLLSGIGFESGGLAAPHAVHDIIDLSSDLGLPVTLADIGLTDPTDELARQRRNNRKNE